MTTNPKPKTLAPCSVCGLRHYVRKDGTIGYHTGAETNAAGFRVACAGVNRPPAQVTPPDGEAA